MHPKCGHRDRPHRGRVELSGLLAEWQERLRHYPDELALARIEEASEVRFSWKRAVSRPYVTVRQVDGPAGAADGSLPHRWMEFRCGDVRVLRYRRVDAAPAAAAEEPPP